MKTSLRVSLIGLGLAGLTLTTPLVAAAKTTELTALISGPKEYLDGIRQVFDAFERQNPDIKITILPTDDIAPKFRAMYLAGLPPDILRMRGEEAAEFGSEGLIEDLTPRIKAANIPLDDFFPPALPSLSWEGKLYALPLGVTIESMLYNKELFDAAGAPYPNASWAWEREVLDYGKKMTRDTNGDGTIDQFFLGGMGSLEWFPFVYAGGGSIFSADGTQFLADSAAGIEGLQFVGDLKNAYHITPNPAETASAKWSFELGNIALNYTGSWFIGSLRKLNVDFDWDAANVPTFKDTRATNLWPETPFGIPATSKHKDEAWRVLQFVVSREGQSLIAKLGLATPIRLSVARSPAYTAQRPPSNIMAFVNAAAAPQTRALPTIPAWGKAWPVLYNGVVAPVYSGAQPARQAMAAVAPQINAILSEME